MGTNTQDGVQNVLNFTKVHSTYVENVAKIALISNILKTPHTLRLVLRMVNRHDGAKRVQNNMKVLSMCDINAVKIVLIYIENTQKMSCALPMVLNTVGNMLDGVVIAQKVTKEYSTYVVNAAKIVLKKNTLEMQRYVHMDLCSVLNMLDGVVNVQIPTTHSMCAVNVVRTVS